MKTQVHLALTMAIDAKLLVLDEPTLGLDILARSAFYDALVNDYMDETRTILITTHQVEEIEKLLTDVLFIDKGRIVLDASLDDIATRYAAITVAPDQLDAARAEKPFYERRNAGQSGAVLRASQPREARRIGRGAHAQRLRFVRRQAVRRCRMNTTIWLVRREFWENRAIWLIPAVIGGFMILIALFGKADLMSVPPQWPSRAVGGGFLLAGGATFFAVMSIYSTWYLLDCLYADRKDRSILFWKSLPISDTTTVLSKLATALIVIPAVYFAAADLTTLMMAFIISVRASSAVGGVLWHADLWLQLQVLWLYMILTTAIWYLPVAAYLLVVSAWARRAVMLWSILPPVALLLAERWFFGSDVIARQLGERLFGFAEVAFRADPGARSWVIGSDGDAERVPAGIWNFLNVGGFLTSPATWIGVAVGAALIACAIQLRTRRTEI